MNASGSENPEENEVMGSASAHLMTWRMGLLEYRL